MAALEEKDHATLSFTQTNNIFLLSSLCITTKRKKLSQTKLIKNNKKKAIMLPLQQYRVGYKLWVVTILSSGTMVSSIILFRLRNKQWPTVRQCEHLSQPLSECAESERKISANIPNVVQFLHFFLTSSSLSVPFVTFYQTCSQYEVAILVWVVWRLLYHNNSLSAMTNVDYRHLLVWRVISSHAGVQCTC